MIGVMQSLLPRKASYFKGNIGKQLYIEMTGLVCYSYKCCFMKSTVFILNMLTAKKA